MYAIVPADNQVTITVCKCDIFIRTTIPFDNYIYIIMHRFDKNLSQERCIYLQRKV